MPDDANVSTIPVTVTGSLSFSGPVPNEVPYSTSTQQSTVALQIKIENNTSPPVPCSAITFSFPYGSQPSDLVGSAAYAADIGAAATEGTNWTFAAPYNGQFTAAPQVGNGPYNGAAIYNGAPLGFIFSGIVVNDSAGQSTITVTAETSPPQSANLQVNKGIPGLFITAFYANPIVATRDAQVTLTFATTGATDVTIVGPNVSTGSLTTPGSMYVFPTYFPAPYTLTATNGGESARPAQVIITGIEPRISSFTVDPDFAVQYAPCTLSWTTSNATSAKIDPGARSVSVPSGTLVISPAATTSYVLTAYNDSVSPPAFAQKSATINVYKAKIEKFYVSGPGATQKNGLTFGYYATLIYSTTGASTIALNGKPLANPSGTFQTAVMSPPGENLHYTLTVTGLDAPSPPQVTVYLAPVQIRSFTATKIREYRQGYVYNLSWNVTNALSCTLNNKPVASYGVYQVTSGSWFLPLSATGPYGSTAYLHGPKLTKLEDDEETPS